MTKIKEYLRSDSLWIQIIASLIVVSFTGILALVYGLLAGINFNDLFDWLIASLNSKVSFFWLLILFTLFVFSYFRLNRKILNEATTNTYSKIQVDQKLDSLKNRVDKKLDITKFERFSDVYDYRRLKNHPFHEIYSNDNVETFVNMIKEGNQKSDKYKLEHGMAGLAKELQDKGWIHISVKNEVKEEIENCFTSKFMHEKIELNKVLDTIKVMD